MLASVNAHSNRHPSPLVCPERLAEVMVAVATLDTTDTVG